jgi:hypothetical protein
MSAMPVGEELFSFQCFKCSLIRLAGAVIAKASQNCVPRFCHCVLCKARFSRCVLCYQILSEDTLFKCFLLNKSSIGSHPIVALLLLTMDRLPAISQSKSEDPRDYSSGHTVNAPGSAPPLRRRIFVLIFGSNSPRIPVVVC